VKLIKKLIECGKKDRAAYFCALCQLSRDFPDLDVENVQLEPEVLSSIGSNAGINNTSSINGNGKVPTPSTVKTPTVSAQPPQPPPPAVEKKKKETPQPAKPLAPVPSTKQAKKQAPSPSQPNQPKILPLTKQSLQFTPPQTTSTTSLDDSVSVSAMNFVAAHMQDTSKSSIQEVKEALARSPDALEFVMQCLIHLMDQRAPLSRVMVEMLLNVAIDQRYRPKRGRTGVARNNPSIIQEIMEAMSKQFDDKFMSAFRVLFVLPQFEMHKTTDEEDNSHTTTFTSEDSHEDFEEGWLLRKRVGSEEIIGNKDSNSNNEESLETNYYLSNNRFGLNPKASFPNEDEFTEDFDDILNVYRTKQ